MSDLVRNPEDEFSRFVAHVEVICLAEEPQTSVSGLFCLFIGISSKNGIKILKSHLKPLKIKVDSPK